MSDAGKKRYRRAGTQLPVPPPPPPRPAGLPVSPNVTEQKARVKLYEALTRLADALAGWVEKR